MVLDVFESLGGFYGSIDLIIFMLAEFFSSRFFIAMFASTMFVLKTPKY